MSSGYETVTIVTGMSLNVYKNLPQCVALSSHSVLILTSRVTTVTSIPALPRVTSVRSVVGQLLAVVLLVVVTN
jgi:hypothetical protein